MPKNTKTVTHTYAAPDAENPEWTKEKFDRSIGFKDLPAGLRNKLSAIQETSRGKRGPQKSPTKTLISIRLSADVLDALKATGKGWQSAVDETLRRQFVKQRLRSRVGRPNER
jgi:uncharacterized protein (DUF4415 family)